MSLQCNNVVAWCDHIASMYIRCILACAVSVQIMSVGLAILTIVNRQFFQSQASQVRHPIVHLEPSVVNNSPPTINSASPKTHLGDSGCSLFDNETGVAGPNNGCLERELEDASAPDAQSQLALGFSSTDGGSVPFAKIREP